MSTNVSEVRAACIIRAIQLRTRQYIPEDSELHTRRRENLKSHIYFLTINGKSSAVQVGKKAGWQGKWTESCSISDRTCLPPPRQYIKRKLSAYYLARANTH
jgi:hypothetical protein